MITLLSAPCWARNNQTWPHCMKDVILFKRQNRTCTAWRCCTFFLFLFFSFFFFWFLDQRKVLKLLSNLRLQSGLTQPYPTDNFHSSFLPNIDNLACRGSVLCVFTKNKCFPPCCKIFTGFARWVPKEAKTFWRLIASKNISEVSSYTEWAHMLLAACWAWACNRAVPFSPTMLPKTWQKLIKTIWALKEPHVLASFGQHFGKKTSQKYFLGSMFPGIPLSNVIKRVMLCRGTLQRDFTVHQLLTLTLDNIHACVIGSNPHASSKT